MIKVTKETFEGYPKLEDHDYDLMTSYIASHDYTHWYILGTDRPFVIHLIRDYLDNDF